MKRLKERFSHVDPVVGNWLSIGHSSVAELTAMLAFDFAMMDLEHTPTSLETIQGMVHAVEAVDGPTEPMVRIPDNDPVFVKRVLDTGVSGVMVPMIDSAAEARELVAAAKYPPEGRRGIAGSRAAGYGLEFEEYVTDANDETLVIAQIETERGLANAEEIAAVDGVDAIFAGPADLSGSLGVFGEWESDRLAAAMECVADAAAAEGLLAGTLAVRPEDIDLRAEQGFECIIVGKDAAYIADGSREAMAAFERAVEN